MLSENILDQLAQKWVKVLACFQLFNLRKPLPGKRFSNKTIDRANSKTIAQRFQRYNQLEHGLSISETFVRQAFQRLNTKTFSKIFARVRKFKRSVILKPASVATQTLIKRGFERG